MLDIILKACVDLVFGVATDRISTQAGRKMLDRLRKNTKEGLAGGLSDKDSARKLRRIAFFFSEDRSIIAK